MGLDFVSTQLVNKFDVFEWWANIYEVLVPQQNMFSPRTRRYVCMCRNGTRLLVTQEDIHLQVNPLHEQVKKVPPALQNTSSVCIYIYILYGFR